MRLFPWVSSLQTVLFYFETLSIFIVLVNGESLSTNSSTNQFFYNGRYHELPTITITRQYGRSEIVKNDNGTSWKIVNLPDDFTRIKYPIILILIVAKATFPLYIFYENYTNKNALPIPRQERFFEQYSNQSSYTFQVDISVYASLILKTNSIEFRSNVEPFFGISVRYFYDKTENTISIYTSPEIPVKLNSFFHQLTQKPKDEECEAYLHIQQTFDSQKKVFENKFSCYFVDGVEIGDLDGISKHIDEYYIDQYAAESGHKKCIRWCKDDPNCLERNNRAQTILKGSFDPHCKHWRQSTDKNKTDFYFPPVYWSLPEGNQLATEIYFNREDIKMEKMIRIDPFEKYQQNGSVVNFRCSVSKYFAGLPIRLALKYKNIPDLMFLNAVGSLSFDYTYDIRSTSYQINIQKPDIERVFCIAPVLGSYDWINASRPIHVFVPAAPLFLLDSQNITGASPILKSTFNIEKTLIVGTKNEALICNATGEPSPEISWTWNNQTLAEFTGKWEPHQVTWSLLSFALVDKTIEGEYICKAKNNLGEVEAKFNVVVVDNFDPTITIAVSIATSAIVLVAIAMMVLIRLFRRSRVVLTEKEWQEFLNGSKASNSSDPHSDIFSKALDTKYIIDKSCLSFNTKEVLGSGQFGVVMKGWLTDEHNVVTMVAVKTTKEYVDVMYVKALISEIKIMAYIGDHHNIIKFIGTCINDYKEGKLYAAVEFCENGDLLRELRKQKTRLISSGEITQGENSVRHTKTSGTEIAQHISNLPSDLVLNLAQWSHDIASGMAFISSKNVIHGDLAARNVLLTKDNVAKISDFGLARQLLNDYSVYTKKTKEPLPWKWMALESLTSSKFSVQSDVWAFGVTLWEIFSLGDSPYPGYRYNEDFVKLLTSGTRPSRPRFARNEIFNIMERCWNENPQKRPDMSEICDELRQQLGNTNASTAEYVETCETKYTVMEDSVVYS